MLTIKSATVKQAVVALAITFASVSTCMASTINASRMGLTGPNQLITYEEVLSASGSAARKQYVGLGGGYLGNLMKLAALSAQPKNIKSAFFADGGSGQTSGFGGLMQSAKAQKFSLKSRLYSRGGGMSVSGFLNGGIFGAFMGFSNASPLKEKFANAETLMGFTGLVLEEIPMATPPKEEEAFETPASNLVTPLPGAALLFATAVAGALAARRKGQMLRPR
ncbi:MAG: hypothetical protein AAF850_12995 [Pseudomonadota bacterium]